MKRTVRETLFKKAVSKALVKSKSTTRALSSLLKYDVPRGPARPRSISIWSSTASDLAFILSVYVIDGAPIPEQTKKNAARLEALLTKKMGYEA